MRYLLVFLFPLLLLSCDKGNSVDVHECKLISVTCVTETVVIYDYELNKEVTITYSHDLFNTGIINLKQECGKIFYFHYIDESYYPC
jgi:hypothetical protein